MRVLLKNIPLLPLALFFIIALNYRLAGTIIPGYITFDVSRILELSLLMCIGVYLLISFAERRVWLATFTCIPSKARIMVLGIFALGVCSSLLAPLPNKAFLEVSVFFLIFCFIIFIAMQRVKHGGQTDVAILCIVFLGVITYEYVFLQYYVQVIYPLHAMYEFPGFNNVRFLAHYLTWTVPFLTLPILIRTYQRPVVRILIYVGIYAVNTLWWALIFANSAKGMLAGLLLGFIVVTVVFRGAVKSWLRVQLHVIGLGFICYWVLFNLIVAFSMLTPLDKSIANRTFLWQQAINLIVNNPLFGAGPMHYSYYRNPFAAHPHNSILQIGSEWGLLVLALVLILFIWGFIAWFKKFNSKTVQNLPVAKTTVAISLTVSSLAASFQSLTCGVLVMPISQVMLCVVVGWMLGFYHADKSAPAIVHSFLAEIIFMLLIGFALAGVIFGIVPDIFQLTLREFNWLTVNSDPSDKQQIIFNPRFWIQGWLR